MNEDILILEKKIADFNTLYEKYKKQNSIDNIELKECLCDILTWFEICLKTSSNFNSLESEKVSGIKYANNVKKHSISIFKYTLQTYALFPSNNLYPSVSLYPSDFNIFWNSLPLDNSKFVNQYNNYKKHFESKELYSSLNEMFNIIKSHCK
ncbi:MAG: hypothetical protein HFJ58_07760 [Clostridia bacterium]|nr:hypothetical protein [Clostridia bacterium]